jgi:hypothetical protein
VLEREESVCLDAHREDPGAGRGRRIDLVEMKYYKNEFAINREYADRLAEKKRAFIKHARTKKTVHIIIIAKEGLKSNSYSHNVQVSLDIEDLWDRRRRRPLP